MCPEAYRLNLRQKCGTKSAALFVTNYLVTATSGLLVTQSFLIGINCPIFFDFQYFLITRLPILYLKSHNDVLDTIEFLSKRTYPKLEFNIVVIQIANFVSYPF